MLNVWSSHRRPSAVVAAGAATVALALSGCASIGAGGGNLAEQVQPPTAASPIGAAYAAFGDSYSAGEGTDHYLPGTDVPGLNVCHRSTSAYSQVLAAQLKAASTAFAACSGAVTADLFAPNNNHNAEADGTLEPAQLCQPQPVDGVASCGTARPPALGPETTVVTLTIGGNDAGFARVVESCVFGKAGRYSVGLPGRRCRYDPVTIDRTLHRIAALAGQGQAVSPYGSDIQSLSSVLAAVHAVAPDAQVYIAGYPRVFQPPSDDDCVVGAVTRGASTTIPLKVGAADARALDDAATALNATIATTAAAAGRWATYVDPTPVFAGHGICTGSPWINPVQAGVAFDATGRSVAVTSDPGSMHPTERGQQGYAAAFLAAGFRVRG